MRFQRPNNTIDNFADLKVGDHIWHVYGIWQPQMGGEHIVTREPGPFRFHPEYSDIHELQAESIVFDVRYPDWDRSIKNFASDGNMVPGHSHNDNYWFRSEADALAAVEFLRGEWEKSGLIAEEIARREEERFYDYAD